MQNKIKNIVITFGFIIILFAFLIANMVIQDKEMSETERRKLAEFPRVTIDTLTSGDFSEEFEQYALDQFVLRDSLRSIKSYVNINLLRQKDNNKLFIVEDAIYKIEYPLQENNIKKSAQKINEIYQNYLEGMNVYYAIIPDKNYYLNNDEYLKMDYNKLKNIMQEELTNMEYIDIWDSLTLEDYYRTDTHWKQQNLGKVVGTLQNKMNLKTTSLVEYTLENKGDFYGVYYGQLGLKLSPDKLYILKNQTLENCKVYNEETKETLGIYNYEKYKSSSDKYDIYLSGATYLITIENPNALEEKELLLFRDSYGSSIAPLLVENYSKITLIDTRYISSKLLDEYINFENQDVLFLYSTSILNQNILK